TSPDSSPGSPASPPEHPPGRSRAPGTCCAGRGAGGWWVLRWGPRLHPPGVSVFLPPSCSECGGGGSPSCFSFTDPRGSLHVRADPGTPGVPSMPRQTLGPQGFPSC
uniref:Uncharacterized protein n=1 Tax=Otus sunia TaxID=257818 RepID=A0A8C8BMP6_9STRI